MERISIDIFKELELLAFPEGHYMLVGSAMLAAKGIRPAYDLDIVVSQELFESLKADTQKWQLLPWTRPAVADFFWLKGEKAEVMTCMSTGDKLIFFDEIIPKAEIVNGVPMLSLSDLIIFKRQYGRPKDFVDIALIEKYLQSVSQNHMISY